MSGITGVTHFTIGCGDLDRSLALYRDVIGLKEERRAVLEPVLAEAWGLDPARSWPMVELSLDGYPVGRIRLLQVDPDTAAFVRSDRKEDGADTATDVGPKAVDFYVRPPMSEIVALMREAGCPPRSDPIRWQIGTTESEELLFTGPDQEPILMMIGWRHAPTAIREMPPEVKFSEVATQSVVCGDLELSRRFYGELLGQHTTTDDEVTDEFRPLANTLTGVAQGTRSHFLLYQSPGEPSGKILLVHFFDATGKRLAGRMRPGNRGVSLFTYRSPDLDRDHRRFAGAGFDIVTPPTGLHDAGWGYRRTMLVKGPNEELIELVSDG